jgi:hypothetical protein
MVKDLNSLAPACLSFLFGEGISSDIPQVASHLVQFCLTVPAEQAFFARDSGG